MLWLTVRLRVYSLQVFYEINSLARSLHMTRQRDDTRAIMASLVLPRCTVCRVIVI